jgi:type II secretory pathway pseudopilin PulG
MFCFKCGASMPDDSKACPQCATPVENAPAPPPSASPTPPPVSPWLNVPPAQPQYPQGQHYPAQGQPYGQPKTDGQAIASLVLGIAAVFLCFSIFAGIPAIILGHISWSRIRRSMGRLKGEGMAMAGLIMGYVSIPWILIIAAIAIPNLLRAKISANESAAATTVRTINTAQVTYTVNYPDKGYAPDLATLGPGPSGSCGEGTADHACLLDNALGNASCTVGSWCTHYGYKFSLSREGDCAASQDNSTSECNYVVVATPISTSTGRRSFCSTSDAVIRYQSDLILSQPINAQQCSAWQPI